MSKKTYIGIRSTDGTMVVVKPSDETGGVVYNLPLCLEIANHSPTGFEWGYQGSGPAQLALAILVDFTGDTAIEPFVYQQFKATVIANIDEDTWSMTDEEVAGWLLEIQHKRGNIQFNTPEGSKDE